MNDIFTSRYFKTDDPIIKLFQWGGLDFEFYNRGWWSRIYEYQWVIDVCNNLRPDQLGSAIDIATGIQHPGMFMLKSLGFNKVVGVDLFEEKDFMYRKNLCDGIFYVKEDINYPSLKEKFSAITCISFLEHIRPNSQEQVLQNIINYVSESGCIIMTFDMPGYDYPTNLSLYKTVLERNGFKIDNKDVEETQKISTQNSKIAEQVLRTKPIYCYRLFAWR